MLSGRCRTTVHCMFNMSSLARWEVGKSVKSQLSPVGIRPCEFQTVPSRLDHRYPLSLSVYFSAKLTGSHRYSLFLSVYFSAKLTESHSQYSRDQHTDSANAAGVSVLKLRSKLSTPKTVNFVTKPEDIIIAHVHRRPTFQELSHWVCGRKSVVGVEKWRHGGRTD